jgi:membrane protein DedA with SNARE-associated domain
MLEEMVAQYGYAALLAGTFLEGETILIMAGFAAHQGYLKLIWVIFAAFTGSLAGDQFYFLPGRLKGGPILQRHPVWQLKAIKVGRAYRSSCRLDNAGISFHVWPADNNAFHDRHGTH